MKLKTAKLLWQCSFKISKTQIEKNLGGSIIKPAVKALASVGLRFGAEKALKLENLRQRLQDKRNQAIQTCLGDGTTIEKDPTLKTILLGKERFAAAIQRNTLDFSEC